CASPSPTRGGQVDLLQVVTDGDASPVGGSHRAVPGGIADLARVPRPDVRQGDVAGAGITGDPTHVLRGGVGTGEEVQQRLRVPGLRVVGNVHDLVDEQVRVLGQPHDIVR